MGEVLSQVPILIGMIGDYISGRYRDIPLATLVIMLGALLYLFEPVDAIPDLVPIGGYVDDAGIIAFVINLVGQEVERYKQSKQQSVFLS